MQLPSRAESGSYGHFFLQKVTNFLRLAAAHPPPSPCNYRHPSSDVYNCKVQLSNEKPGNLWLASLAH